MSLETKTSLDEETDNAYNREVVYGCRETMQIDLGKLVKVSQVRKGTNQELINLKESIQKNGLLNQIDVARMRRSDLKTYLEFVNNLWSGDWNIEDYQADSEGFYYLVIAGHSRVEAIEMIAQENPDIKYVLDCKIYDSPSPKEVISIQLAENIHQQPAKERQAIAIVETYHYGLLNGEWESKSDFIRKNEGRFSKYSLNQAMNFASLPEDVRGFVSTGAFSYVAAVELGRILPMVETYFETQFCNNFDAMQSEDMFTELDALLKTWLASTIAHIQNNQLNGPAAKKYIQGLESNFRAQLSSIQSGQMLELEMVSPTEQMREYRKGLERKYALLLKELSEKPLIAAAEALSLHFELLGDNGDLKEELNKRIASTVGRIGRTALTH